MQVVDGKGYREADTGLGKSDLKLDVLGGFMGMLMEGMKRIDDAGLEE